MTNLKTPRAYSVAEFCSTYAVGRSIAFELIAAGKLKAHKLGHKTIVLADDAEEWLRSLPQTATPRAVR
jgi:hypothetical protein